MLVASRGLGSVRLRADPPFLSCLCASVRGGLLRREQVGGVQLAEGLVGARGALGLAARRRGGLRHGLLMLVAEQYPDVWRHVGRFGLALGLELGAQAIDRLGSGLAERSLELLSEQPAVVLVVGL